MEKKLLTFPCVFPLKIVGKQTDHFVNDVRQITLKFFPKTPKSAFKYTMSKEGNYVSVSVTLDVAEQETLDNLYKDLTSHPDVRMVL
ncbi:MAG: DUF493 domain-containing protein [Legionellaceae bacterium]|nr:DUF493 domain-containing protein [Legionellaceae bacterium]